VSLDASASCDLFPCASWIGLFPPRRGPLSSPPCLPLSAFCPRSEKNPSGATPSAALLGRPLRVLDLELLQAVPQRHRTHPAEESRSPGARLRALGGVQLYSRSPASRDPVLARSAHLLTAGLGRATSRPGLVAASLLIVAGDGPGSSGRVRSTHPRSCSSYSKVIMVALASVESSRDSNWESTGSHGGGHSRRLIWTCTIQNGVLYDAATRTGPFPQGRPLWYTTVQREVASGTPCSAGRGASALTRTTSSVDCTRLRG